MSLDKTIDKILSTSTGQSLVMALTLSQRGADDLRSYLKYVKGEAQAKGIPFELNDATTINDTIEHLLIVIKILDNYKNKHLKIKS